MYVRYNVRTSYISVITSKEKEMKGQHCRSIYECIGTSDET